MLPRHEEAIERPRDRIGREERFVQQEDHVDERLTRIPEHVVTDFAHEVKACALGQASSSIMASHVVGSKAEELRKIRDTVRKMLKENGEPPRNGKWADIAVLEPVRDYKARHASTMLTFDAVVDAIGQIEARDKRPAPAQG